MTNDDILTKARAMRHDELVSLMFELNNILTEKLMRELPQHLGKPVDDTLVK